jgi:GxxExxY protein
MPIECSIEFPQVREQQMREMDYRVMAQAFAVHNELGRLYDEFVYKNVLRQFLVRAGFEIHAELPILLKFGRFAKTLYIDTIINSSVPYELKVAKRLWSEHVSQILLYMLLVHARRGKLINFGSDSVESRFVNATLTREECFRYRVISDDWTGSSDFKALGESLFADWGISLSVALYTEAITANLNGESSIIRQVPMNLHGQSIGQQRFHLAANRAAFQITAFNHDDVSRQRCHLQKLITPAEIDELYWINVSRHEVTFRIVRKF